MVCKFHHYSKATANISVSTIGLNSLFFNIFNCHQIRHIYFIYCFFYALQISLRSYFSFLWKDRLKIVYNVYGINWYNICAD